MINFAEVSGWINFHFSMDELSIQEAALLNRNGNSLISSHNLLRVLLFLLFMLELKF